MKLKISISRTLVTFLVASLIAAGLIFGMCFSFFLKWPWEWQPYVIISLWLVSSIFFLVLTIKLNYYELTRVFKAPQNMMLVRDMEDHKYKILISIRPEWLCKILNGEKTIEVRKKVLKEML